METPITQLSSTLALAKNMCQMLAISAGLAVICRGLFDTHFWNEHIDARIARWLPNFDSRPVLAIALGLWFNSLFRQCFFLSVMGYEPNAFAASMQTGADAVEVDILATGILFGLGPKVWIALAPTIFKGQKRIMQMAKDVEAEAPSKG